MKRKPEQLSAEERRRFIDAARQAGVNESGGALKDAVQKLVRASKRQTFTAPTEAEARTLLGRWKEAHPAIKNIVEHEPVVGTTIGSGGSPFRRKRPSQLVSISIEYD